MTAHAPLARVPFAPLDNPRLQHLANAKNRQNGLIAQKSSALNGKPNIISTKSVLSPVKRSFEDDFDSENVDPAVFDSPSKKTKSDLFDKPVKPFTFNITPQKSMPPPPTIPSRLSTPARANMSSPRAPMTAPAGRSPQRKMAGISKNRRVSAPFSRIDPPGGRVGSTLPFSLDAALSGTLTSEPKVAAGATIQESMPKSWFFEIYEDTPEEEAANLMEHSTLTLDLSSDDECVKKEKSDRGKENTPPEGYDAPTASQPAPKQIKKTEIIRKKVVTEEMDDGERSPLCSLETDPFIPEGLDKDSHVVVDEVQKTEAKELFTAPVPFTAGEKKSSSVVVDGKGDVKGEIIVWEDTDV
ncbi:hypothetical protein M409DRAFT_55230 [Zasmidium cellare ATCC 36951]|uniref:Thymidylate kinase n=1 Tax=Zasmidium cellare ATCC 36951 TaxID=1080233 RepID=A0A6A6CGW3_ZASCE|nr:uncharacterized protein M409DRAFT_55230 [Zasmidium cellare ATCC 36951]KAF2166395.1 hypothetical protein M409DRAFT_55230 [Zasmidium cellare ATCC 36951]